MHQAPPLLLRSINFRFFFPVWVHQLKGQRRFSASPYCSGLLQSGTRTTDFVGSAEATRMNAVRRGWSVRHSATAVFRHRLPGELSWFSSRPRPAKQTCVMWPAECLFKVKIVCSFVQPRLYHPLPTTKVISPSMRENVTQGYSDWAAASLVFYPFIPTHGAGKFPLGPKCSFFFSFFFLPLTASEYIFVDIILAHSTDPLCILHREKSFWAVQPLIDEQIRFICHKAKPKL